MKTSLCYLQRDGKYLMLYRNKKENDINEGKYLGVGGKFMLGETPEQCVCREVREETGLILTEYQFRGMVYFVSDRWDNEDMYLFTATGFTLPDGTVPGDDYTPECNEGTLHWIPIDQVEQLPMWDGDKYFLRELVAGNTNINLTCEYVGDTLTKVY